MGGGGGVLSCRPLHKSSIILMLENDAGQSQASNTPSIGWQPILVVSTSRPRSASDDFMHIIRQDPTRGTGITWKGRDSSTDCRAGGLGCPGSNGTRGHIQQEYMGISHWAPHLQCKTLTLRPPCSLSFSFSMQIEGSASSDNARPQCRVRQALRKWLGSQVRGQGMPDGGP